ncbi:E2 ligase fold family C protein [Mesorhizobium sp. M1409]|uniref:E2 ligase fold family C protein n=1 Tax=unclassified Mesorhizobium TaxID=325217 RepID=UPI00333AC461
MLARLYPVLAIVPLDMVASSQAQALERLAKSINPKFSIRRSGKYATVCVAAGAVHPSLRCPTFFMGSQGWAAKLSRTDPVGSGSSLLPFGAGAASCFAAANVFRTIFASQLTGARAGREHRPLFVHLQQDWRNAPHWARRDRPWLALGAGEAIRSVGAPACS